jgi:hypothetical protein
MPVSKPIPSRRAKADRSAGVQAHGRGSVGWPVMGGPGQAERRSRHLPGGAVSRQGERRRWYVSYSGRLWRDRRGHPGRIARDGIEGDAVVQWWMLQIEPERGSCSIRPMLIVLIVLIVLVVLIVWWLVVLAMLIVVIVRLWCVGLWGPMRLPSQSHMLRSSPLPVWHPA